MLVNLNRYAMENENSQVVMRDVHEIKNTLTRLNIRLEIVYNCLVGNEISKDGGLVADILTQKTEMSALLKRIDLIERGEKQRNTYVKILWAIAAALMTIIIEHYFK